MYADEDLIPISALQHHLFCPRQCALIHVDGLWAENRLTAEGRVLHERSDTPGRRVRRDESSAQAGGGGRIRTVRALPLLSRCLGLIGKADQIELPIDPSGVLTGPPRPIEHKRGRPKRGNHDRVQLAAQALCLEEMFEVRVPLGELFYHAVKKREHIEIDQQLRDQVTRTIDEIRDNITLNRVPSVKRQKKCDRCSLLNLCLPSGTGPDRNPGLYVSRALAASLRRDGE